MTDARSDRLDRFFADALRAELESLPAPARARVQADRLWPDEATRLRAEEEAMRRLRAAERMEQAPPVRGVQRGLFGGGG